MKKILITGSSGSIGTALSEALITLGYEVTGADIRKNRWNAELDARTIQIDLTDPAQIAKLPNDVDCIIHLAAHSRVWDLVENPRLGDENIAMLQNVLEHARAHGIHKILFSSSREAYGSLMKDSYAESDVSIDYCENAYAMSKLAGEALLRAYKTSYGIDSVIVRLANVYGRYDILNRVIPLFIARCVSGKDIRIFGKGKVLDFTYIDDTVAGIVSALQKFDTVKNDVFNIASGYGADLADVAHIIKEKTGSSILITVEENRAGEVMRFVGNIEKARRVLGYTPHTNLEKGIAEAVLWYSTLYKKEPETMPALGG